MSTIAVRVYFPCRSGLDHHCTQHRSAVILAAEFQDHAAGVRAPAD